jgi:uncharacterized RDD family membrane protein YckC
MSTDERATTQPGDVAGSAAQRYPWHVAPPAVAPVRPEIQRRRAGFVTRAAANTVDLAVVALILASGYVVVVAFRLLTDPASFRFPAPGLGPALLVGEIVHVLYFSFAWVTAGRTYGDRLLGLRVVDAHGHRTGWLLAIGRAVFCVAFPLGLFWVLISPANRSVQDVVLRTSVIYDWSDSG